MTAAAAKSENSDPLNLECITGDLGTIRVFCESLDHFICDLRSAVLHGAPQEVTLLDVNSIDVMAFEIKSRIETMQASLNEFIAAAPAAHLWAERKSA